MFPSVPISAEALQAAADYALLQGLLKYPLKGQLTHAPFTVAPAPIAQQTHQQLVELTASFQTLYQSVSAQFEGLEAMLAPLAQSDAFLDEMLAMARQTANARAQQPLKFLLTRNDYFLATSPQGVQPRQVEMNMIAAGYGPFAGIVHRLHAHMYPQQAAHLVPNHPLEAMTDAFEAAVKAYGYPHAGVLLVVQFNEKNRFDQRLIEFSLKARGIPAQRVELARLTEVARIKEGHLEVNGVVAAVTYLRAGYGPEDWKLESEREGRRLIEESSTLAAPELSQQLAGTKKVQQMLARPGALSPYVSPKVAQQLESAFAIICDPEDVLERGSQAGKVAWQAALQQPQNWVLKPQREGGGYNLYDDQMVNTLKGSTVAQRKAYILMERLRPAAHAGEGVLDFTPHPLQLVPEIGRFGAWLGQNGQEMLNRDMGYLVRSKAQDAPEGGVSAGYGFLDSLYFS